MKTSTFVTSTAWLLSVAKAQQFVQYTPNGDDTSVQRADPILAPGTISQHVHQIFGSNGFSPSSTYEELQQAGCTTVGDAEGNGNAQDKSIYWHPALYMEASDGSGYIKVPTNGHKLYYKNAGTGTPRSPFEFPHGFRMLAGNPFMRAPATDLQQQNITQWICHTSSGPWNQGTAGGFPNGVTSCDAYPGFNGAIHFPHCWNGNDFDPANPTAHVVYPTGDIEEGTCPSSHPTRLPHIFIENQFNIDALGDTVKPGSFVLAMGDNTGYGWHADFYNGWDDGAIPALMASCPQGEYGNEDIGSCPSFQKFSTANTACKLKTTYVEKVDKPGPALPGCNPIRDTNPAPIYAIAPLGTYSTNCKLASGGPPPGKPPKKSSTLLTSTKTSKPTTKTSKPTTTKTAHHPHGSPTSAVSCPGSNNEKYFVKGKQFQVQCGTDHVGGDLKMVSAQSLGECIAACAAESQCVDVSLSGTACYMKSSLGAKEKNSAINGARLVSAKSAGTVTAAGDSEDKDVVVTVTQKQTAHVLQHVTVTAGAQRRHLHNHARGAHLGRRS